MNNLFLSFSQMAKILAVSQDLDSTQDSYQNSLNIIEAIDVFHQFGNKRAKGVCYQNLGCLTAKLDRNDYTRARSQIIKAI